MKKLMIGAAVGLTVLGVACQPPGDKEFAKAKKSIVVQEMTTTTEYDSSWMTQGQTPYPGSKTISKWVVVPPSPEMTDGPCTQQSNGWLVLEGDDRVQLAPTLTAPGVHVWYDDGSQQTFRCTLKVVPDGLQPASPKAASQSPKAPVASQQQTCQEDDPCWDCRTMGNRQCATTTTQKTRQTMPPIVK